METDPNSNISFLTLLLAPEENTIEDHHLLSLPASDFYNHWQNPSNLVASSSSLPSFDVHNFYHSSKNHLQSSMSSSDVNLYPKNYLLSSMPYSGYDDVYHEHHNPLHYDSTNTHFRPPLPGLFAFENSIKTPSNTYYSPPQNDDYTLNSILANYQNSKSSSRKKKQPQQQHHRQRNQRQNKISEKVYNLGKLLPGGHRHRKSTADMLKEAHKYIKFLQAQVRVLKAMPAKSQLTEQLGRSSSTNAESGLLERLSRQQLLQVMINSSAAQVVMADNGWCLFSAEQVALIKKIEARQKIVRQLLSNLPL